MTNIFLHNINPVIIDFGTLKLTYYGLAYAFGIIFGVWYLKKINKKQQFTNEKYLDDIVIYSILGIVIGGRIGYVGFYKPEFYLENPVYILKTWEGGMSFHGGLIGFIVSIILYCRKYKLHFWKTMDLIAIVAPIGLFFGRIANFINGELYGRKTNGAWGVIFPSGGDFPRHPSQIYQAFLEGILLFVLLNILFYKTDFAKRPKSISGAFLIFYGLFRVIAEVFREPDEHLGYIGNFTMGQILSFPMILIGSFMVLRGMNKNDIR